MELRFDVVGQITNVRRTPQGGLDVPANLTRTGIFLYRQPDGTVRKEYRPAEEVFTEDSLATLAGAPLTVGHPGLVRPDNWQQVSVGHVADEVKHDAKFVQARVRIQQASAVQAVERKDLVELSCGYTCDVEPKPGVTPDGEHYDAVQRNIRYNHVSLLPLNGGRAGNDVKLRMDGLEARYAISMPTVEELQAKLDAKDGELAGYKTRAEKAEAALAEQKEIDVDALVASRLSLVQDAQVVLGSDYKADGLSEKDVMLAVCESAFPEIKLDGQSDDYLRGLFTAGIKMARESQANVARAHIRVDQLDAGVDKLAAARAANEERSKNAWKDK